MQVVAMYTRTLFNRLKTAARHYPVVLLDGPRQSGKTTLAKAAFPNKSYISLEPLDTPYIARAESVQAGLRCRRFTQYGRQLAIGFGVELSLLPIAGVASQHQETNR
jgi:hypothetical protein